MSLFLLLGMFFILFTLAYGLFFSAVVYHFHVYTVPGYSVPHMLIALFTLALVILWIRAFYYLLQLYATIA